MKLVRRMESVPKPVSRKEGRVGLSNKLETSLLELEMRDLRIAHPARSQTASVRETMPAKKKKGRNIRKREGEVLDLRCTGVLDVIIGCLGICSCRS